MAKIYTYNLYKLKILSAQVLIFVAYKILTIQMFVLRNKIIIKRIQNKYVTIIHVIKISID